MESGLLTREQVAEIQRHKAGGHYFLLRAAALALRDFLLRAAALALRGPPLHISLRAACAGWPLISRLGGHSRPHQRGYDTEAQNNGDHCEGNTGRNPI